MGKRNNQRKNATLFDSDDDGSVSSSSTAMSDSILAPSAEKPVDGDKNLDQCLDALYEKRGSTREKALSVLIDAFMNKLQDQFVENKSITLLHQFLNCIKRGSAKEIHLASHAIGLLAITIGCESMVTNEILEDSISPLSQALKSGSELLKISSILDCLAVVTFVGGNNPEETEKSMQEIWRFANPKLNSNVVATKPKMPIITAAISAWTFLLTTMDGWKINSESLLEWLAFFSNLLDKDDRSVRIAAGEAIALIFEIGSLEKLLSKSKSATDTLDCEDTCSRGDYTLIQGLRGKILNQVRDLSVEAGGRGSAKKDLSCQRNMFRDVLEFLEDGYCPETSTKIGGDVLSTSTWSQYVQVNFLKRFMGGGFVKHMQENEFLRDVFEFVPKKKGSLLSTEQQRFNDKRMFRSPNSFVNKARTQSLNKKRMVAQDLSEDKEGMFDDLLETYGKVVYSRSDPKPPSAEADDDGESLSFTAFSRPQIDAIASRIRDISEKQYQRVPTGDYKPNSWTLLDFGDVVVHVFLPEQRAYYNLEDFYGNAKLVDLPFENQPQIRS
ncbi:hypothetical protein GIB67_030017 [Kingdonia uniflora]|uniref:Ribosomal silencing factor RsfS n=1 Tax=Kingdonia uniflora TaxID=39325 RepID=A0A7J7MXT6_9MAGN|nr:hypothetical protein GIB67_030017 [Kingdonia uniflora]